MADQTEVHLRPLRAQDQAQWRALWTDYLTFYGSSVSNTVYDSTFARLIGDDAQDFHAIVAELDGRLVGLVHYLFHRHCWRVEDVCYLQDLFAAPDVRGHGIGRKLIEVVYAAADQAGAPQVYWLTQAGNSTARQLYDRIGTETDFIKYQRQI